MQQNPQVPHIYAPAAKNRSRGPVDSAADNRELDTMGTMKITGLAALALVATLAVTGCSGNSSTATSTGVAATSSAASSGPAAATPAPTPTAAPIKSGQHLTAEQVKSLPQTARAYTLADGSLVATVIGEALPAEVVTDITAKAQVASGGGELNTQVSAAQNTARAEALGATLRAVWSLPYTPCTGSTCRAGR
jgi:hypothetical protein